MMLDTSKLKLPLAIIGLIIMVLIASQFIFSMGYLNGVKVVSPVVVTPSPAVSNTINYPSVLTFTVLSATTSTGRYQVLTTAGNILYFNDYYLWNSMYPQSTYTATLTGYDGVAYYVGTATLIRSNYYYQYPYHQYNYDLRYYHWYGKYYQCDMYTCDPMQRKQVVGEDIIEAEPPLMRRGDL